MLTSLTVQVRKVVLGLVGGILFFLCFGTGEAPVAHARTVGKSPEKGKYYSVTIERLSDGKAIEKACINGPPVPPLGFEVQRQAVSLPVTDRAAGTSASVLTVPAFNWVFGCSAVSGAMIAGYYDRSGYADMYNGPANGGVIPLDNSSWPTWSDGSRTYPSCPLIASKSGVDGRVSEGSIDDYWIQYGSTANDPYITGGWTQHTWGDAVGDYMMTSQSAFSNSDGSTTFYNWSSSAIPLTCDVMASYALPDGTLGRKHFYEARGYTVTDCYNQKTDNTIAGGFSFAQFKSEIEAGRPVMLNLEGHTVVGVGYDDTSSLVYIHDTWDYGNHTMTWGGSYSGMDLKSVSIVNLLAPSGSTLSVSFAGSGTGSVTSNPVGIASNTNASHYFALGTVVTLTASNDQYSLFLGWSGACSGTADCVLTMDADKSVTVTFNRNIAEQVRLDGTSYSTIMAAYQVAVTGNRILIWGTDFSENFTFNRETAVTLAGGYNSDYTSNSGYTTLTGPVTIQYGSLIVENMVIK